MSPECPACHRRLSLRPGHEGTFKSSCPHVGCGAELLCIVASDGSWSVKGPTAMRELERTRELAARASRTLRSFWFSAGGLVLVLGILSFYAIPFIFAAGGPAAVLAAIAVVVGIFFVASTAFWIRARLRTPLAEPLPAIEGVLEEWRAPQGYRG